MENYSGYLPFRKSQRFNAQERALVFLPLDSRELPYHIIDICESGLSFLYLGKKIKTSKIPPINLYYEGSRPSAKGYDGSFDGVLGVIAGAACCNATHTL